MTLSPDLLAELKKSIAGSVRTDLASRILYSTDASIYQIEPLGVVIPRDQDDLQAVVELAAKYKTPILPRGSGSSLAGQAIGEALIVDISRWLDNIIEVNPETRTATVEPGVILAALNKAAAKHGLQFGPDPASAERATVGGVIANNATGAHSILYGMAADHILAADVVMADGSLAEWKAFDMEEERRKTKEESLLSSFLLSCLDLREKYAAAIQQHYPTTWRNSAGYRLNYLLPWSPSTPPQWTEDRERWTVYQPPIPDSRFPNPNYQSPSTLNLAPLLAGSEGTLAVIRRATLNLVPKPKHTILAVLNYDSSAAACDDVPRLLEHRPSAIELISRNIVRLAMAVPAYAAQARILAGDSEALLVVEFSGDQPEVLKEQALALSPDLLAESAADQSRIWNIRKMGLGILASHTGDAKTVAFIEDCAIPVERLGGFVRGVQHILDEFHTQAEFYAHASAGCLHIRPILNLKTQVRELRGISEAVLALTISLGGSMSSEHGDGLSHSEWLGNIYGDEVLNAFRTLKLAADPERILNPGKLIDAPRMDANLRYGLDYRTKVWPTPLDFSHQDGLSNAIEQCNGQGVCRKFDGVMCPSFQATREEQNATRGRANLLRAMISSNYQLPITNTITESVFTSLDLCLACKGCKSECPSGVDMAKIKFAFMGEYYKTHRRPLRDYLFGYFHTVSALLAPIAPLANAMMGFDPTRKLIAKITGITTERPFPKYSMKRAHVARVANPRNRILFLSDAFTRYIEPQVEQAAFDVLSRLGYDVQVIPVVGAGASLLSKGFIDAARHHAERVLDAIQRIDPRGELPIVGLEPPDLYCLKHDYRDLLPARAAELENLSRRAWLLDEWLLRSSEFNELRVVNLEKEKKSSGGTHAGQKLKFHPHCHQRAESAADDGQPTGTNATVAVLRACGYEVEVSDAGCCGMAGTFGYEAEHYDLSIKVGELKLLPSIRPLLPPPNAQADGGLSTKMSVANLGEVVSTGSACRLQIEQGAKVNTTHPIVLVERVLK